MEDNNFTIEMNEKLNIELVKMQDELKLLDVAIKHIGKAETISKVVVEASKGIPQRVEKHLNEVLEKYNSYLEASKTDTQTKIEGLTVANKELLNNAEATLIEYKKLAEATEKRSVENHKQAIDSYISFVNKTYNQQEERLNDLMHEQNKQIKRAEDSLSEYRQIAEDTVKRSENVLSSGLQKYEEYLEKNSQNFKNKVEEIANISNEHLNENKKITQEMQNAHQNSVDELQTTHRSTIEELQTSHRSAVDEMNKIIERYRMLGENMEAQSNEHLKKALAEYHKYLEATQNKLGEFLDNLTNLHKKQLQEVKQLTDKSAQLSQTSTELMGRINNIDFPTRLAKIDENTNTLISKSANNTDDILLAIDTALKQQEFTYKQNNEQFEKRLNNQDKELKTLKIGIALLAVFSLITLLMIILG